MSLRDFFRPRQPLDSDSPGRHERAASGAEAAPVITHRVAKANIALIAKRERLVKARAGSGRP